MTTNHIESTSGANTEAERKSTRQNLAKIPNVPNLYRHKLNGTYYGIRKLGDKRKEHSLQTTDRKIAERKLAEWIKNLGKLDPEVENTTLDQLLDKFQASNVNNPDKATDESMVKRFKETWKSDLDIRVSKVKPSQLDEWLAVNCKAGDWKNTTYNKYCTFLRRFFDIAVKDKMIAESPMDSVKIPWKKPQKVMRHVPTLEQFQAIVDDIRAQPFNADAEDSADFIEFMGNAGLGQAELKPDKFAWNQVDLTAEVLYFRRQKTGELFPVPIYNNLKPLVERLAQKPHKATDAVLKIKDARKALSGACKRLGYYPFSQRNIRAVQIRRLWQAGIDKKLISKWQGHQDGGRLIMSHYTEVFGDNDAEYIKAELSKVKV